MTKNQKKKSNMSFWEEVKNAFKPSESKKIFPWLQSGLLLLGFVLGIFVATSVDIISRVAFDNNDVIAEESEAEKCRNSGGRYDDEGDSCIKVTEDEGNSCVEASQCDGLCLVDDSAIIGTETSGYCSEQFKLSGCYKYMDKGKVNSICMPE